MQSGSIKLEMNSNNRVVVPVLVDLRERRSGLLEMLANLPLLEPREVALDVGDIVIGGLAIERKTVEDFERSIFDGRLFRQVSMLKRVFRRSLIIVEGATRPIRSVRGASLSLASQWQIPLVRSRSLLETVSIIDAIALQEALRGRHHTPLSQSVNLVPNSQRAIIESFAGLGPARAEALLMNFGSVLGVLTASTEAIAAVPGIGRKIAHKIREVLERPYR